MTGSWKACRGLRNTGTLGLCIFVIILKGGGAFAVAPQELRQKVSPVLLQAANRPGQAFEYLVLLPDDVNLSAARQAGSKAEKGRLVYETLREQASRSQAPVLALLRKEGVPYRAHYLLNAVQVRSRWSVLEQLAAMTAVERIHEVVRLHAGLPLPSSVPSPQTESTQAVEWGVSRVHAPQVWSNFGIRGEGIVIGVADTGMGWTHTALKPHYRGWNGASASHDYNWHDSIHDSFGNPCGNNSVAPCDDDGHGTHVTGTAVGDDGAGNQIGVAPGAKWIGCRNMDEGVGTISRYIECMEFFLAPYPVNGSASDGLPELAADIVSNSWGCTAGEGCDLVHLNALQTVVRRLEAAGILVVGAAGNDGPSCGTVAEPLAIYPETFAVAATNTIDNLASFSSRGPVTIDGSGRRKPDISAPGVSVRSSYSGNSYDTLSGTSMATPHVAGVAALLWSAAPQYRGNVALTKSLLQTSADHRTTTEGCGGDSSSAIPNNSYGYGIVNALSAIQSARRIYFPIVFKNSTP